MSEVPFITVPVVAGVVLFQDDKFLLVQEKQPRAYKLWNWPAGKVDRGESFVQAAIREAKEEVGLDVEIISELGMWQTTPTDAVTHAFVAKIIGGELKYSEDEMLDARWLTIEEMREMKDQMRGAWVLEAAGLYLQHKNV